MKYALAAIALVSAPAFAQTTATRCQKDYWGNVTCRSTTSPSGPVDFGTMLKRGQELVPDYAEQQAERAPVEAPRQPERPSGPTLCERAYNEAFSRGDVERADQILKICGNQ